MVRKFPDPSTKHPIVLPDGQAHEETVFLRAIVDQPNFLVGDYTYASSDRPVTNWVKRLAPYLFEHAPERLVLGKFCQIANGTTFVTSSANHRYDGFSSYPFAVMDGGFDSGRPSLAIQTKDTFVGHDVWFGRDAMVLPGTTIESGVIVGAGAIVSGNIPAYSIVAGNPARLVRRRFDDETIARLLDIAWWNWPIDQIIANEDAISGGDIEALNAAFAQGTS